jgi:hypothetical protein
MAFKFNVDSSGNLVSEAKREAAQESAAPSRFAMQVDQSGNIVTPGGIQQRGLEIAEQYRSQTPVPDVPGTWTEIRDAVTGELRETPQTRRLPELSLDSEAYLQDPLAAIKTTAGLLFSADDESRKKILKKWNPDIQIETDEKGNDIVTMPSGEQAVLNQPGFSKNDFLQLAFDAALFSGGTLAAAPVKGTLRKGVVGALGAGLTETGRQQVGQELGTEEPTDIGRIATTAAAGGLAEAVPAAIGARKASKAQRRLGIAESQEELAEELGKQAKRSDVITEKTGIELGRAQKTRGISDAKRMTYVSQLPAAEQKAMKFFEKQNKQAYRAVADLMDTIAPAETVGQASRKVRKAAQDIVGGAVEERARAAKPLYEKAFKDKTLYNPQKTIDYIDDTLKNLPEGGERRKVLEKVGGFLSEKLNIKQLDETKIEIDGIISSELSSKKPNNRLVANLMEVKDKLLQEVDKLNPDYKAAREIYSKKSPGIQELQESTIGTIAKKKDEQIKTVARALFEPDKELFDPAAVRKARSLIEKQDPEAWNGIVRAEWQRRLGKAKVDPGDLTAAENVPAKLRSKIFGSGKEREVLYSAMSQEQKKNARYLEEALKRAEKGRPGGSPTAVNQVFERELRGVGGTLRGLFSDTRKTIAELGADAKYDMRVKALADVMFDPKWQAKLKDLRRLSPDSRKSERAFVRILKQAIKSAAVAESPESPAATRRALEILNKDE